MKDIYSDAERFLIQSREKRNFFLKYLNDCYIYKNEKYPNSVFHIYDLQLLRQRKLNRILNKTKLNINLKECKVLFEENLEKKLLMVDATIWNQFKKYYTENVYTYTQSDIKMILYDTNLSEFTPISFKYDEQNKKLIVPKLSINESVPIHIQMEYELTPTRSNNFEMICDLSNMHGIDQIQKIESELVNELSKEISKNIKENISKYIK